VITGKNNFFDYRNERVAVIGFKAADSVPENVWDGMLNTARRQIQDHPERQPTQNLTNYSGQ